MDISLAYPYCQPWRSRATHYPKSIRYSSANHRNARKESRSRRQRQGKLVESLWFLPVAIIKKLFRVQLSCISDAENDLI
jgi:hypothetical protein